MSERNAPVIVLSLTLLALAACGDGPSGPPAPAQILVTPSRDTITVTGGTVHFSAQVLGKKGQVLSGVPITWTSNRPTVAEISETGMASAMGPGEAEIRATADGVVGLASLTVVLIPTHSEKVGGDGQTGVVGEVLDQPLEVKVTDAAGVPLSGVKVTFEVLEGGGSVFPWFFRTDSAGIAQAEWTLGPDPAEPQRLKAYVGEITAEFQATGVWPPPSVVTTNLRNGRLTIDHVSQLEAKGGNGASFTWTLQGGILPPGMSLSPQGALSGIPTEEGSFPFNVQVEDSEGEVASGDLTLLVCPAPTALVPGEAEILDPTEAAGCGFFIPSGDAGDRYRVGIVRSESNRDSEDVPTVTLEVLGVGVEPIPAPVPDRVWGPSYSPFPPSLREAERWARSTEAYHLEVREEERELLKTLPLGFKPLPSLTRQSLAVVSDRAQGAPTKRSMRFPTDGCSDVMPKTALLLGENEYVAVYQDSVQNQTEPVVSAAVQTMLDYYRDYGNRVIEDYFGGVSDVNGDGQVVVFVAPGIKDGVAGFVRSSDMLGREICASSNEMELTYLKASFVNGYQTGYYQFVGTLVHEIKHISSLYRRLVAGRFHPSWVEEGTAEIATDRASRLAISETGGPEMGAMLTLDDIEQFGRTIEGYNTMLRLARSLRYLASQPNAITVNPEGAEFGSPSGPQARHTIYGAGWHFHRWLGDAYGGAAVPFADTALFRAQNDSLSFSGPEAYPDLVGRSFSELMEEYAVAVMLNGTDAPPPFRAITSVDFPSAMNATSVINPDYRPFGTYPWPVTQSEGGGGSVSLETATYRGPIGESGLRIHDFTSNGTGQGAELEVYAPPMAKYIVVRLK